MIGLCLAVATSIVASLPIEQFTLRWTHSIERIEWEEDWRIDALARELRLVESRVRGSGAGMEPPDDAVLRNGIWHAPGRVRVPLLHLAASAYTSDWQLCVDDRCEPLMSRAGRAPQITERSARLTIGTAYAPITLLPCRVPTGSS
jgi:hypothetical protein